MQSSVTILQGWVKISWRCNVKEKRLHGLSNKVRIKITYNSTGTRSSISTSYLPRSRQKKWESGLFLTWIKWSTGIISRLVLRRLKGRRTCLLCGTWCGGDPNSPRQIIMRRRWICMEDSTLRSTRIYEKATSRIKSRQLLSKFLCQSCRYFANRQMFISIDSTSISTIVNVCT